MLGVMAILAKGNSTIDSIVEGLPQYKAGSIRCDLQFCRSKGWAVTLGKEGRKAVYGLTEAGRAFIAG